MTFVVTLTPTYNSIALAEAMHEEKVRNYLYHIDGKNKYAFYHFPSVLIGENLKELPSVLKSPKQFFVLYNSGNNSSKEVIDRANVIIDYTVNVSSPNFSYNYPPDKKLLLGIENYPFIKTKQKESDNYIFVSCENNTGLIFNWVKLEAQLHGREITNFIRPNYHPRFVVTDVDEIALEYAMNFVPVMQFPGTNSNLYNYLVFNHLTIPFTIENIGHMIADDNYIKNHNKFLKNVLRGTEENINTTAFKIKKLYETFLKDWEESQRKFRQPL